jgi:hypothetical protein
MKRKDLRNEAEYLPSSLDELVDVRGRVMALGESRRIADGLCMWLVAKARGERDTTAADVRSRYRRILRALEQPEPIGPKKANGARKRSVAPARAKVRGATKGRAVAEIAAGERTAASAVPKKGHELTPRIPASESYVELPFEIAA